MAMELSQVAIFFFYDVFLLTWGTVGNATILLTFGRPSVRKQSTVVLVLALAVADLASCLVVSPLDIATMIHAHNLYYTNITDEPTCEPILCQSLLGVLFATQYYTLLLHGLVTVNRYCTVCRSPTNRMSRKQTMLLIGIILVPSVIIGVLSGISGTNSSDAITTDPCVLTYHTDIHAIVWFVTVLIVFFTIIGLNFKMVMIVRRRQNSISNVIIPILTARMGTRLPNSDQNQFAASNDRCIDNKHSRSTSNLPDHCPKLQHRRSSLSEFKYPAIVSIDNPISNTQRQIFDIYGDSGSPSTRLASSVPPSLFCNSLDAPVNSQIRQSSFSFLRKQKSNRPSILPNFHKETLDRMTKTLLLTTIIFALMWMPLFVVLSVPLDTLHDLQQRNSRLFAFMLFLRDFPRLNHAVNPVIYGFMCAKFRSEFKKLTARE